MTWSVLIGGDQLPYHVVEPWSSMGPAQVAARAAHHAQPGEIVKVSNGRVCREFLVGTGREGTDVRPTGIWRESP